MRTPPAPWLSLPLVEPWWGFRIEGIKMTTKKKVAKTIGRNSPWSGLKIIKLTKKGVNPHHDGTHSQRSFALIRSGMTVDEFMRKGGRNADLRVSIARGFVKLTGKPKKVAATKPKASKKSAKKVAAKSPKKKAAKKKAKATKKKAKAAPKKAKAAPKKAKAAPKKKAAAKPKATEPQSPEKATGLQATDAKGGEISENFSGSD